MKVLLEYVAALPPHHLSNPSYLSLLLNLLIHTPLFCSALCSLFSEVKKLSFSLSLWNKLAKRKVCNFYTSCNSRMCEIFHIVWHEICKATWLSACSQWLILRRISFISQKEDHLADLLLWLITLEVSLKDLFCMTCNLHQGKHFTWHLQFDKHAWI